MKNTIKFAALGACALAATSTAALAGSESLPGLSTGVALGAPLPEGVYDISIFTPASRPSTGAAASPSPTVGNNLAVAVPVWLIWSTPWQIAGGRIILDATVPWADVEGAGNPDSFLNPILDAQIKWNFGNGWNAGFHAGAWLPSEQTIPAALGRDYTAFQGIAAISYLKNGWNLSATFIYGSGGDSEKFLGTQTQQAAWFNYEFTATKKFGKMEIGAIAYGSEDLSNSGLLVCELAGVSHVCKQSQFALGGLVGYDFGSFEAQFKLSQDVAETNYITAGHNGEETRAWLNIIKPLWHPEAESLK